MTKSTGKRPPAQANMRVLLRVEAPYEAALNEVLRQAADLGWIVQSTWQYGDLWHAEIVATVKHRKKKPAPAPQKQVDHELEQAA